MNIYNYDKDLHEYLSTSKAKLNPQELGKYLIPKNATAKQPLVPKEGYAVCFNESLESWEYKEDNRDKEYYLNNERVVFNLGDKITDEMTISQYTTKELLEISKITKLAKLASTYSTNSTENITYKNVVYKGGDASASAIAGSITLAESLKESEVTIIANDDSSNVLSFNEALELSALIAKSWRDAFFEYKRMKIKVNACTTKDQLNSLF